LRVRRKFPPCHAQRETLEIIARRSRTAKSDNLKSKCANRDSETDRLDTLDFRILRELVSGDPSGFLLDPRISLRQLAKRLGVDKDTVRNRMKKLRDTGFVLGWASFANPSLFGVKEARLQFNVPPRSAKDDLVRKFRLIPGVTTVATMYGDSFNVGLFYESEESLKKSIELISRISNAEDMLRFDNEFPKCEMKLSKTDWRIVGSLQRNPRKPYNLISREIGLSTRTVKRRLEKLVEGRAIITVAAVDSGAIDGTMVSLLVFYTAPKHRGEVNKRILSYLDDCVFRAELNAENHGFFNLILTNIARVQEISRWMKDQQGISSYHVDLVQEFIQLPKTLSELLEKNLAQVQLTT
jgi:DNA-binding Lrp family transcriptional regulator